MILSFAVSVSPAFSQKIELFRSEWNSANPYGGIKELESFVQQEMVFPEEELENKIKGEVFISYVINAEGKVASKEVTSSTNPNFSAEAERIFSKILWEKNPGRASGKRGKEKIKFQFHPKRYQKLVKKRGYHQLPMKQYQDSSTTKCFTINQVDQKPEILNASSVNYFVQENFKYPTIALQRQISGKVVLSFVIEPYGLASNVRVLKAVAGGCSEETVRLVKAMKWSPALINGKAVRTLYEYELNFIHPGGTMR